jgi:hypothetical protein
MSLCYTQLYNQGTLNDFQVRRAKFVQQSYDERVLLWMVVIITISGVFLAGVQIIASYRLAAAGRGGGFDQSGEIALQRDRISLKSSITGLFILIISFAFFYVFVLEILPIKEVKVDPPLAGQPQPAATQLSTGGIGTPPTKGPSAGSQSPSTPKQERK